MPVRTPKDLTQSLKQGKIEPVYFLFGPEAYLRDEAARAIAEEALRNTLLREFNESSFNLLTDDVGSAVAIAEQLPMMSDRRVVHIRNFGKLRDADEEVLVKYLARPVETTVLIFTADDLDKRKKLARSLMAGAAFDFQPLKPNDLQTWIKSYLKKIKVEIEPRAGHRIMEIVRSDLHTVINELNKLAAASLPSGRITTEMVDALISRSREHMNWELSDHLVSGNRTAALKTVRDLLDDGVEPVLLIGLIAGTYRRMALANSLLTQGAAPAKIFSEVRMQPFKQGAYLSMLRQIDSGAMAQRIQRIAQADLAIKTSKATPRMQVEMLVCELMN
ncbi:MAG: polymerase subunit delta [Blastocatellia bacterium]|jgi:DNA polymerase-3 subunit delta|nr:polymerase subunit delta [Blastocatellia bacterium]